MMNLSLDELRLIAQVRNISDYENKSKDGLIKALSEPKPEPETKTKIAINKKKLEEIRKKIYELRHNFSKIEKDMYRKAFYVVRNYRNCSISEIKEAGKNYTELKKKFKVLKISW